MRQRMAKAERERKLAAYNEEAKKGKQDVGTAEAHRKERLAQAEEDKKKKIEHFNEMAATQAASYHAGLCWSHICLHSSSQILIAPHTYKGSSLVLLHMFWSELVLLVQSQFHWS